MKLLKAFLTAMIAVTFLGSPLFALEVPELKGRVNDYADILSSAAERQLETVLAEFERTDSTQIAVLTIRSLKGDSLEDFSIRVAEKWKIGRAGNDNGAILLVSKQDRKIRIEVGYGLESKLTDLMSGRIIRNVIAPNFKSGNFDAGIVQGVSAMIGTVKGLYTAESKPAGRRRKSSSPGMFGFFALLFILNMLGRISRPLGAVAGGVIAPILGALFGLSLVAILILIPVGLVGGLFLGLFGGVLNNSHIRHRPSGRGGGFWIGGGGLGGGGGGFGGFSGGGGGFGGGGASGGW